jgi:hypothetical protein
MGLIAEELLFTIPKVYYYDELTPVSWAEHALIPDVGVRINYLFLKSRSPTHSL